MANIFNIEKDFTEFKKIFLEQNSRLNLISKNDEKVLFEKHIYDSLAIKLTGRTTSGQNILDIGCGGGFPSVPIAIEFPDIYVTGIDSIRKKINAINNIKEALNLTNLSTICDRAENLKNRHFDIVTARAVADLSIVASYALPLLKKDGVFVAYKSKKASDEIDAAKNIIKSHNAKILDIIEYTLPLDEIYHRNLIIIGF